MANETEFNYEPLSSSTRQIRLLRILPTTTNIEIECELQTSDLPEEGLSTPFAAISYEWGAATALKPITVNGKRFWIRPNCHYALLQAHRYLCRKRGPSLIWVDSVCINQDDIDERSEQVALMGKLYSAASVSLACVGPAELDSEWMFRILKSANSNCTSICWEEKLFAAFNNARSTKVALNEAYKKYLHKRFHGAALCFSARTYWTRRWIVQEMLLPRTVVVLCGNFLAGFDVGFHDQIAGFNGIISSLVSLRRKGWAIDLDTGSRYDKFEKRCLAELLSLLRQQKCSERHDWIYALLGVSKFETNKNDTPLVPDYRRSDLNTALHTIDVLLHCASYNGSAIDRDYGFVREIVNGLCLSLGQTDVQAMFQRRRLEKIAAPRDGARDQIFARIRDAESAQIQGSIHKLSAGVNDMLEVRGFQLPGYYPSPDARFESYEELPDGYQSFASPAGPLIGYTVFKATIDIILQEPMYEQDELITRAFEGFSRKDVSHRVSNRSGLEEAEDV
ncbi:hypothetical protein PRZ48_012789 [Zasmidium cellare]|uniref:Heterokaryon incompatibility domain-containing protein n=1 Tax=Zasmidium cellare TaxID=395010 RepID=A0ABR0E5U8_ZASCE|nr:hypothetical protein PRZ48_012789 [Zasmidium cellare]